jgi:hypothetical protein
VVNSSGTVIREDGIASASKPSTGLYHVDADFPITGCAYYVTIGDTGVLDPNQADGGYARVGQTSGNSSRVTVIILQQPNNRIDLPFHIAIVC